jgi:hypothetical protein
MAISDYDSTPANNTSISGINIGEGCSPGNLNDATRQLMADIAGSNLQDVAAAGAPSADGEFLVATGAGAVTWESGATARTSLGLGTIATQDANSVALTGGNANGVTVGNTTPAAGTFTTLTSTGNADIGGDLDVNGGNVSLDRTGDAAQAIFRTVADSGQVQGLRLSDPTATAQDAILTDGSDNLSVGDTDWTSQTLVGSWSVSGAQFNVTDGQLFSTYSTNGVTARITNDNASFSNQLNRWRTARTANSAYNFLQCQSDYDGTPDVEFVLSGDGNGTCDGSWTGGGADYAEFFEWLDGNPLGEDRRGFSVVLDGDKIRPALPSEEPLGVISANPSVVGDGDIGRWKGKYLRDDFGAYIWEDCEVAGEEGETVIQQRRKLNPAFDPELEYLPRADRPEWDTVGLMGKLRLRKGQPVGARWVKMRDVSATVEEWLVR